jgi:Allophanate hydrolase C-terminal domain
MMRTRFSARTGAPFRDLMATEPPELELGIIELEDGEVSFAMLLRESEHARGVHRDITEHGGWRAYRAASVTD